LRKDVPVLVYGAYTLLRPEHETVYAYTREFDDKKMLVLPNFPEKESVFKTDELTSLEDSNFLINNYNTANSEEATIMLKPFQAVIYFMDQ